jgi:hypothetical protein
MDTRFPRYQGPERRPAPDEPSAFLPTLIVSVIHGLMGWSMLTMRPGYERSGLVLLLVAVLTAGGAWVYRSNLRRGWGILTASMLIMGAVLAGPTL